MPGTASDPPPSRRITAEQFDVLVRQALDTLPEKYHALLTNISVVIEAEPDPQVLRELGLKTKDDLLGLYSGISRAKESFFDVGGHLPARISIYRGPILRLCRTREEVVREVRDTVVHEIGHHVGLDDEEMPY